MFMSFFRFVPSFSTYSPIFIDISIALLHDSSVETSSSSENPLPAPLNRSNMTNGHLATSHALDSSWVFEPCRFNRASVPHSHLEDYHRFSTLTILHEPHTHREASAVWQKVMSN